VAPVEDVYRGRSRWAFPDRSVDFAGIALGLALCASIAAWFSSIRSALWLDETVSYWQISGGFWQIWERQGLSPAAYAYILWATKSLFGSNEIVLRMPSVLAMLAATYVLYLIAREFFSSDIAAIVAVIFCLHPTVAFAAVDARPYAFAVLLVNCAILSFLRFMKTNSSGNAILLGASAAAIFYFHYLFGLLLPALALVFFAWKGREWRRFVPKLATAGIVFSVMILPIVSRLVYLFRTGQSHVFDRAPQIADLLFTMAPGRVLAILFIGTIFAGALLRKLESPSHESLPAGLACLFLATIPLGVLYDVSTLTSLHVFTDRYRLVAVPGIALCWGFLASCVRSKAIRVVFGVALVALTFSRFSFATLTIDDPHGYTWKYSLQVADKSAATDNAPLLICSDLPESNFEPMPADVYAATDGDFAPIFYYKVHSRVIPLPRALNREAVAQINKFLATAMPAKQRFLALGFLSSNPTLDWITRRTKDAYLAQNLGTTDGVTVMEYKPR
jgi:Dolichyl-phosphate-mannose-protein mannosyltransferase